jgi:4-hydroxy-tetrahydrodipicolinate synthase
MRTPQIKGVVTPIVTPFKENGQIDLAAVDLLVDYLIDRGIHALMVAGSTGEGMLLSVAERKLLFDAVVKKTGGRIPVLAHTGSIDTQTTLELTRYVQSIGADCASMIVPFFYTYDEESLFLHFVTIANAVPDFPIMLYVFPGNAKNDISPGLLKRLCSAAPNIIGIKSSNDDLSRFADYINAAGSDFTACFGVDELMLQGFFTGSKAQVSGNSNVCPEVMVDVYNTYQSGDLTLAKQKFTLAHQIMRAIHFGQPLAYYKEALKLRGIPAGTVRSPQRNLTPEECKQLKIALCAYGVIS